MEFAQFGLGIIMGLFIAIIINYFKNSSSKSNATNKGNADDDDNDEWEDAVSIDSEDEQMTTCINFLSDKSYNEVMNAKFNPKNSEIKMVLCVRNDLGMAKGKIGA